jgi:hypothetical protein
MMRKAVRQLRTGVGGKMQVNGIEVESKGPYSERHLPFGRGALSEEKRYCFWQEGGKRRSCSIVQDADGNYVSGTFHPLPRSKTLRGVLRQVVGKDLCPLT